MLILYGWYSKSGKVERRGKKRKRGREPKAKATLLEIAVARFEKRVGFPPTNLVIRLHANTEMSRRSTTLKRLGLAVCVAPCHVGPGDKQIYVQNPPRGHFFLWGKDGPDDR